MRNGVVVEMTYQSFRRDAPSTFEVEPWCVKVFKQRWYLVAKSVEYGEWLWYKRNVKLFDSSKIMLEQTSDKLICTYNVPMYAIDSVHSIINSTKDLHLKYIYTILDSKLGNYIYSLIAPEIGKVFAQV